MCSRLFRSDDGSQLRPTLVWKYLPSLGITLPRLALSSFWPQPSVRRKELLPIPPTESQAVVIISAITSLLLPTSPSYLFLFLFPSRLFE